MKKPPPPTFLSAAAIATAACLSAPAAAAPGRLLDCMIQPHQVVQVGSPVAGVIESIAVERGDTVRRGQVLVQLQAQVERAALAAARERAEQIGELNATHGAQDLARKELQRATELFNEQFVSRTYVDKARAENAVAGGRIEQAQERRRLSDREVAVAQAQLTQRTVRAPIDGVVVDRFLAPGEYVEQKPLLRIAAIDPLRVDVLVPAAAFGRIAIGAKASVTPELIDRVARQARVTSVDRVIDAASNTFRVRLELPNPEGALPAGLRCQADLGLTLPEPLPARLPGALPAAGSTVPSASPSTAASAAALLAAPATPPVAIVRPASALR